MKKFKAAVVLSGCGVFDGSEIHEAVITLLNIQKLGGKVSFFAPDTKLQPVNHLTGEPEDLSRSVMSESARIARGNIANLSNFDASAFDMLVFPGGFGAAKNLSDFAIKGADMELNPDVKKAIDNARDLNKPLGFICISPVIAAKAIGNGVKVTIGKDAQTAAVINMLGAEHVECEVDSFVKDENFNTYSTPAYMLAETSAQVDAGVGAMLSAMANSL